MSLTFANKITIARIIAVPLFIATVLYYSPERDHLRYVAFWIFLFASVSDIVDGYIARKRMELSKVGAILDPLADKLLLISAFICVYKIGVDLPAVRFPIWLVVTVISRDVIVLLGVMIIHLVHGRIKIKPSILGKGTTFFQALCIMGVLLQWTFSFFLWYVAAIVTVLSALGYIQEGAKVLNTNTLEHDS